VPYQYQDEQVGQGVSPDKPITHEGILQDNGGTKTAAVLEEEEIPTGKAPGAGQERLCLFQHRKRFDFPT
tara:strand:+ start:207 stop:416 length:210 start_codon:yes stop_codon:yes gene_type:complete